MIYFHPQIIKHMKAVNYKILVFLPFYVVENNIKHMKAVNYKILAFLPFYVVKNKR